MQPPSERARRWLDLIDAAARDFAFAVRPSTVTNTAEAAAYLQTLIAHVDSHDLARGFELRVGTKQSEWTPDMVDAFKRWMTERPRRDPDQFAQPFNVFKVASLKVPPPIDDATLRRFVDNTLEYFVGMRTAAPTTELPLLVGGLLSTAELLTTTVDRADRIPFITAMARTKPLYGWFVASDMFIHSINVGETKSASKQDVIGIHFGTRTVRGFLVQPYNVVGGRVEWLPVREDLFQKGAQVDDPYAFVFAPATTGAPS
jgi:hypothetical protein